MAKQQNIESFKYKDLGMNKMGINISKNSIELERVMWTSVKEAANRLGMTVQGVWDMVNRGVCEHKSLLGFSIVNYTQAKALRSKKKSSKK